MQVGKPCEWRGGGQGVGLLIHWFHSMLDTTAAVLYTSVWQGTSGVITEGAVTEEDNDVVGFKSGSFCNSIVWYIDRLDDRHLDSCLA